jgi:LysM repeat protein
MKNFLIALLAGLSVVFLSAVAEAGGGTKNNGQIRAVNNGDTTLVLFLNSGTSGNQTLLNISAGTTVDATLQNQFNSSGGRTVAPGSTTTFSNLAAGDYTLTAEFLDTTTTPGTTLTGEASTQTVHVNKGQTVTVSFTGNATGFTTSVTPTSAGR